MFFDLGILVTPLVSSYSSSYVIIEFVLSIVIFWTKLLTQKLLKTDVAPRLKSSLQNFYGRHYELVDRYEISISQITIDLFAFTQICSFFFQRPDFDFSITVNVLYEAVIAYAYSLRVNGCIIHPPLPFSVRSVFLLFLAYRFFFIFTYVVYTHCTSVS